MADKKQNIAAVVASLVKDAVEECGCTLWDVAYAKEGGEYTLTIYIDREGGVALTDCEMVNDAVNPLLDETDPIEDSYCLEISSPGLERELRTPAHFAAFRGEKVTVKLYKALENKKTFVGTLKDYDEQADAIVLVLDDGTEMPFAHKDCAAVKTVFDY